MEVIQQNTFAASSTPCARATRTSGPPGQSGAGVVGSHGRQVGVPDGKYRHRLCRDLPGPKDRRTHCGRGTGAHDRLHGRHVDAIHHRHRRGGPRQGKGAANSGPAPRCEGAVPGGYFVAKSKTYGVWLALRLGSMPTAETPRPKRSTASSRSIRWRRPTIRRRPS